MQEIYRFDKISCSIGTILSFTLICYLKTCKHKNLFHVVEALRKLYICYLNHFKVDSSSFKCSCPLFVKVFFLYIQQLCTPYDMLFYEVMYSTCALPLEKSPGLTFLLHYITQSHHMGMGQERQLWKKIKNICEAGLKISLKENVNRHVILKLIL